MEEKKYLGGNLTKNVCFGLAWLPVIGWIIAIVELIADNSKLELEEKRELVTVIITALFSVVANVIPFIGQLLGIAIVVCQIVESVFAFTNKPTFTMPGAYHLAALIIK